MIAVRARPIATQPGANGNLGDNERRKGHFMRPLSGRASLNTV